MLNLYYAIYSYIWVVLIFILFLLYISSKWNIILNTNFKTQTSLFVKYNFFFFLLSLAGVPPLVGFFNKIFLINIITNFMSMSLIILFIIINTFLLVFYIQQVKFLQTSKKKFIFNKPFYVKSIECINFFLYLQFVNLNSIWILPNLLLIPSFYLLCIF